jgi:ATP-dependent protease ClpP protease subunit
MKKTISIVGDIGSFEYIDHNGEVVKVNGIQLEDVIAQVERLSADTRELVIECGGLGGLVDVAKSIRGYLKSKAKFSITTKQVADLASANTIIFSIGKIRQAIADDVINPSTGKPYFLMVHEPLTPHASGPADKMDAVANALRADENEMISIYNEDTGISEEAIRPLMKAETYLSGSKAVALKLATETYTPLKQAAYHLKQKPKMKSGISKVVLDAVLALLTNDEDKAKIKKALAVAPPAELMGKPVTVDGKPAVDGVYTVVGGVVTSLEDATEEQAEPAATAKPDASGSTASGASKKNGMEEVLALLKDQPKKDELIAAMTKVVDEKITTLKKSITTNHIPDGYTPETSADDVKEWDRSWKANEHTAMRKNDPEKYKRIFFAKWKKMPNL